MERVRVVVVGAGISGLCCARLLAQGGHEVTLVSADRLQRTTSYLAAAVWFPTAVGPPRPSRGGAPPRTTSSLPRLRPASQGW